MRVIRRLDEAVEIAHGSVVAIGFFDGVHRGHQHLLGRVVEYARRINGSSVALTFEDHPQCLFTPGHCPSWLTSVDEKIAELDRLGLDFAFVVPFDWSVANRTAEEFVRDLLCAGLRMRRLVCGADFALGKGRQGTVPYLRRLGVDVEVVEPLMHEGELISSSCIRDQLVAGEVARAAQWLGRPYRLSGDIVSGRGLGRQIGVPTVNLAVHPRKVLPANGVYAVRSTLDGVTHPAALNIGCRPTVGGDTLSVEFHVIDAELVSTPACAALEFVERLRDERKFDSLETLTAQIARDLEQARGLLNS